MRHNFISSRQNMLIRRVAGLRDKSARSESRSFIAEGSTLVFEALDCGILPLNIFINEKKLPYFEQRLSGYGFLSDSVITVVTAEVYAKLSCESAPEGILCELPQLDNVENICNNIRKLPPDRQTRAVILENLQDPGNVGAIIRCASAFGISAVVMSGCADIYNPKTVRSTMGALFKQRILLAGDIREAVEAVRGAVANIYAAALTDTARNISEVDFSEPCAVMIGNEGKGLSSQALSLCDSEVIIPMKHMESLNAATATAIIIYQMTRQEEAL